jgi:hypothetical protein
MRFSNAARRQTAHDIHEIKIRQDSKAQLSIGIDAMHVRWSMVVRVYANIEALVSNDCGHHYYTETVRFCNIEAPE